MFRKLAVIVAAAAAVAGIAAGSGAAATGTDGVFLCYSPYQVDPGVWPQGSATQLMEKGYRLPYAERSMPTMTRLPNGWYLTCKLTKTVVEGTSRVSVYVGETGHRITNPHLIPDLRPSEGYYQVAP